MRGEIEAAVGRPVSRETIAYLETYADLVRVEATRQNLVSAATLDDLWSRHIVDSAQLVSLETRPDASWLDIGSGAGLPGMVVAILVDGPVTLAEPRRLRAEFLARVTGELGLGERVRVFTGKAERLAGSFDTITARAVASLPKLLEISTHLSTRKTRWILPKGSRAQSELADARRNWQCAAEVVPSKTDPGSGILVLERVQAKGKR